MSLTKYNDFVDAILKLHKCYRVQGVLSSDVISKIDFLTKPYAALAITIALHSINVARMHGISYSDIVLLQRRLAQFLLRAEKNEIAFLERLVGLAPSKFGFDAHSVSRRCLIEYQKVADIIKLMNMLREVISLMSIISQQATVDQKRLRIPCVNSDDMLPPLNAFAEVATKIILRDLETVKELGEDPYFTQLIDLMKRKVEESKVSNDDLAAFSLTLITIMRHHKDAQICIEPGIDVETLARKMYNDLISANSDPSKSELYHLYQEIASRSVTKG
ncbi:MAG: hypothetical protein QW632_00410 [Ignisphaera sp.]